MTKMKIDMELKTDTMDDLCTCRTIKIEFNSLIQSYIFILLRYFFSKPKDYLTVDYFFMLLF